MLYVYRIYTCTGVLFNCIDKIYECIYRIVCGYDIPIMCYTTFTIPFVYYLFGILFFTGAIIAHLIVRINLIVPVFNV